MTRHRPFPIAHRGSPIHLLLSKLLLTSSNKTLSLTYYLKDEIILLDLIFLIITLAKELENKIVMLVGRKLYIGYRFAVGVPSIP